MGIPLLDRLRRANGLLAHAEAITGASRARTSIASPWSSGSLERVVWADVFGDDVPLPTTRKEAMSVPAIARGRHLIVGTLCHQPLRTYRGAELAPTESGSWLVRTSGSQSPILRTAATLDDLLFYGWSLWAVERGQARDGSRGPILDAAHVPYTDWGTNDDGAVTIYGSPVNADSVVLFEGLHEGILDFGADSIRTAKRLERTAASKAANPTPTTELHYVGEDEVTDQEKLDLVRAYARARHDPDGAVTWTPRDIELKLHGEAAGALLIEARNASAVDMARLIGLPASLIDATGPSASLKYETAQGRNFELKDYTLGLYTTPIEARLSMDDCTPRGTRVAFDLSDLQTPTPSPSGPARED